MARNAPRPSGSSGSEATQSEGDPSNQAGEGFREVAKVIAQAEFPADREELEETLGDELVEVAKGRRVAVREILSMLPEARFESDAEFHQALQENWDSVMRLEATPREETRTQKGQTGTGRKAGTTDAPGNARGRTRPKVSRGRATSRNQGTKASNRSAAKRQTDRGRNERAGGKSGDQGPGGRGRQQRGPKTTRADRQRKQALGARNEKTRGQRTGAVPGRSTRSTRRDR